MSTQAPPPPPVRFYKVIALSFLFLTIILLGAIIFITSKKATIVVLAKQDKETISFIAGLNGAGSSNVLTGDVTSTKFAWTEKYKPTGTKKVEGTATGEAVLYNKTSAAQTLVKTTRLLTADGVLFRMANAATIPANGQVKVAVYADKKGEASDIGPSDFTIPGLSLEKQKVIYAKSTSAMTGGSITVGILSEQDLTNAKADYAQKLKSAFSTTLGEAPAGVERVISVENSEVTSNRKAGDEVAEFVLSGTSTVVVAEFGSSELKNLLDKEIAKKINLEEEKFLPLSVKPTIAFQSYDLKEGTANLNVKQEIATTLDANIRGLSPENFFGKKKEEIERYVLGLDHVENVDVKFSPSWIFSAPSVADKISVVVKNAR